MGSVCCVAARPHGSNLTSRETSVVPHEPYWLTNTSYSPPPSTWDFQALSQNRGNGNWVRGNNLANHRILPSDDIGPSFSSPSDISPAQQWTPPAMQEISTDDYGTSRRDVVSTPLSLSPKTEVTSSPRYSRGSSPSQSDGSSDDESISNMIEIPLPLQHHLLTKSRNTSNSRSVTLSSSDCFKCGLCGRFLSHKSPWNTRFDPPVAGVLSCHHVFHVVCLEQTTPKGCDSDPPCPVCAKIEEENSQEVRVLSKLSKLTRVSTCRESKTFWGCARARDFVGGATLWSPNRSQFRKNPEVKGNPSRHFPKKLRRSGSFASRLFVGSAEHGDAGSSKAMDG